MEGAKFPPQLEALRLMMDGIVHVAHDDPQPALKMYDQAEALHPDMPVLHYLRAITYNKANEPEKAIAAANKYLELLGEDFNAYAEIGAAYEALDRPADAAAAYRNGLADEPQSTQLRDALKRVQAAAPATAPSATAPATSPRASPPARAH